MQLRTLTNTKQRALQPQKKIAEKFLLLVGIVSIGIPSILYTVGIKNVRALTASFITMLEPLLNPVWVIIFAGEVPSVKTILGGLLILGFIMIRAVFQNRKEEIVK